MGAVELTEPATPAREHHSRVSTTSLLSWNIHHLDTDSAADRIRDTVIAFSPDLVLLQECDWATARSGGVNQPHLLAAAVGMRAVFAEAMPLQGGSYGIAILTGRRIERIATVAAPRIHPEEEPRVLLAVQPAGTAGVATTHLSRRPAGAARVELERLLVALPSWVDVVAGDLNHPPTDELPPGWRNAGFGDAHARRTTWPTEAPRESIDRVVVKGHGTHIVSTVLDVAASDHLPVLTSIERYNDER